MIDRKHCIYIILFSLNFDLFSQIQADAFNVLGRISNIISENYFPTSNLADDYFYTDLNL